MLLRRSLVCREGGGAPVAYGIHISRNPNLSGPYERYSEWHLMADHPTD
jgi:hypothetical protein